MFQQSNVLGNIEELDVWNFGQRISLVEWSLCTADGKFTIVCANVCYSLRLVILDWLNFNIFNCILQSSPRQRWQELGEESSLNRFVCRVQNCIR